MGLVGFETKSDLSAGVDNRGGKLNFGKYVNMALDALENRSCLVVVKKISDWMNGSCNTR